MKSHSEPTGKARLFKTAAGTSRRRGTSQQQQELASGGEDVGEAEPFHRVAENDPASGEGQLSSCLKNKHQSLKQLHSEELKTSLKNREAVQKTFLETLFTKENTPPQVNISVVG